MLQTQKGHYSLLVLEFGIQFEERIQVLLVNLAVFNFLCVPAWYEKVFR